MVKTAAKKKGGLYFSEPKTNHEFISTGCTVLDCVLGGGWPLGHIVNVVGDSSTGKTLLAMEAVANFFLTYNTGWCVYVDAESAFDIEYAKALGIPMDRVTIVDDFNTIEDIFTDLKKARRGPGLYIIDSLDALSDASEMEREINQGSYGASKAKKLSELFRRLVRQVSQQNTCVIVISQVRDAIGVMFGNKHTRSGGRALDFYASQIIWLAKLKTIEKTISKVKRPIAVTIKARCKKNKIGLPFRECEFDIKFGFGIDDAKASSEFLTNLAKPVPKTAGELREAVIKEWYAIEKRFLPEMRKYD